MMLALGSRVQVLARRGARAASSVLTMPALSPTMTSGKIARWTVKEGDKLSSGQVIGEVETDKATIDFVFQDDGYLAKLLVPAGAEDVAVGAPVCVVVDEKSEIVAAAAAGATASPRAAPAAATTAPAAATAAPAAATAAPAAATAAPAAVSASATAPSTPAPASAGGRVVASPYARKLAAAAGIDLAALGPGTGPQGRIVAADVMEYKLPASSAPVPAVATAAKSAAHPSSATAASSAEGRFVDIPHSQMRRIIASRLSASKKEVPHYYLTSEVCLDAVLALRTQLNTDLAPEAKLSLNDFFVKAAAIACRRVPEVNSSWLESAVRSYDFVDVAVAVAVPEGLVTPVVRDAHAKGLAAIASGTRALVEKARAKKLAPEDYSGATFTISNLGMFGVRQFSAIINPPQAAILAVGAAERRVVPGGVDAAAPLRQAVYMAATLSCDHRVVDGAVGAQWLAAFKELLESPTKMLL